MFYIKHFEHLTCSFKHGMNLLLQCFRNEQKRLVCSTTDAVSTVLPQLYAENKIEKTRILKVAIIGLPNAGKSTVVNGLVGRRVCSISGKVHTTRSGIRAIKVDGETQLIFLDTPGLVSATEVKRYNLETSFLRDADQAMFQSDAIGVIHDVANHWTRDTLDPKTLRLLQLHCNKLSFLILNKIDALKSKRKLLNLVRVLTSGTLAPLQNDKIEPKRLVSELATKQIMKNKHGWPYFSEVFMVSALTGSGMGDIKEYLLQKALPGPWLFKSSQFTDQTSEEVVLRTVNARLLEHLPQEIPYNVITKMEYFHIAAEGTMTVVVLVACPTPRIEKLIVGSKGLRIRLIASEAEQELQNTFQESVRLRLVVTKKA